MGLAKGFLQATVVSLWAVIVVGQILATAGGGADRASDPAGGMELLVGFLATLPVESLVVPTVAMIVGLVALEVVFAVIRRHGHS